MRYFTQPPSPDLIIRTVLLEDANSCQGIRHEHHLRSAKRMPATEGYQCMHQMTYDPLNHVSLYHGISALHNGLNVRL